MEERRGRRKRKRIRRKRGHTWGKKNQPDMSISERQTDRQKERKAKSPEATGRQKETVTLKELARKEPKLG